MSGGERCDRVIQIIDEALADYERWQRDHAGLARRYEQPSAKHATVGATPSRSLGLGRRAANA